MSRGDTTQSSSPSPTAMLTSPLKTPPPPPPPSSSTPGRPRNNYADDTTPIASAKRPSKRRVNGDTPNNHGNGSSTNNNNNSANHSNNNNDQLSPMHTIRTVPRNSHGQQPPQHGWVGRKVDALFSPVLSFLNGRDDGNDDDDEHGERVYHDDGDDKDENSVAVSAAIRSALREASEELQQDHAVHSNNKGEEAIIDNNSNNNAVTALESYRSTSSYDDGFDNVPRMTTTDSTSRDADGDSIMHNINSSSINSNSSTAEIHNTNGEKGGNNNSHDTGHEDHLNNATSTITTNDDRECNDQDDHSDYKGHVTPNHNQGDEYEEEEEEFNPFLFIKSLPPYQIAVPPGWTSRSKALPPLDPFVPPLCLVLDLDETLVHCTVEPVPDADMIFPVEFNGVEYTVHVRCRPFLTEFLEKVSKEFEVVVFTASQQVYADKLLDKIDPGT